MRAKKTSGTAGRSSGRREKPAAVTIPEYAPIRIPLSTQISQLRSRPQSLLFGGEAWETIDRIIRPAADFCPHFLLFEFVLNEIPARKVDVSYGISVLDATAEILAGKKYPKDDPWRTLRDFTLGWLRTPDLPHGLRMIGFECDAPAASGDVSVPGLWIESRREHIAKQLYVLHRLLGDAIVTKKECAQLKRFIGSLPGEVFTPFVGLVLGRAKKEVRAVAKSIRG